VKSTLFFEEWHDRFPPGDPNLLEDLEDFGKRRLHNMTRGGIGIEILSMIGGFTDPNDTLGKFSITSMNNSEIIDLTVREAREANDLLFKHMDNSPCFRAFASLPMSSPAAAAEELTRRVTENGFIGAMISGADTTVTHLTGKINYYDAAEYDVLWQKFEELDVPLYIHPRDAPEKTQFYERNPQWSEFKWGFAVSTAELVIDLMERGVFERFPKLKIILGHMGEGLPFWAFRMGVGMEDLLRKNVYVTTSGFFDTSALQHVISTMGVERVLYAVDSPHQDTAVAVNWFEQAVIDLGLNETETDMIEFKTAQKIFGITGTDCLGGHAY